MSVIYLAAFANVHASTYWPLCYILFDERLKTAILEEIAPAFSDDIMDFAYLTEHCPLLDSAFRETLRLHMTSNTVRYIGAPTTIQDKVLEPGNQLVIPLRHLGHTDEIWGLGHENFDPARFMRKKSLASHTAYHPFGGGAWLCPGKGYAAKQVLVYVAYMFHVYEINLAVVDDKPPAFPRNVHENLAFGVSVPKTGMDPRIQLRLKGTART